MKRTWTMKYAPAIAAVALLAGCTTVGPDYEEPEVAVPDAWHTAATAGLAEGEATIQTWWQVFDDPELEDLIRRSASGNLDLREALWRVEEARALRGVVAGARSPQVDLSGQSSRGQVSDNGIVGDFAPPEGFDTGNLHDYGFGAFWEIDVFGRIRRQVEAADATAQASVEAYRDVLVSLYAEVALAYVNLRSSQERLRLAHANVDGQEGTLRLTRDRFSAGLVSALDVAQAESNLANTRSLIPTIERSLDQSLNRLAVLLGRHPGSLHAELREPGPIPHEPAEVTLGLPAELLRQRPDVRRAERALAAQHAGIGVATADLYPSFGLSGLLGLQAVSAGNFLSGDSLTWNIGLPIRWDIFAGGRIRAQIQVEEARTEQLLASYEQTVLAALEEAENAMVAYVKEVERRGRLSESVDATQRSLALVLTQYRAGLTDFQNVLDTQRTLLLREDELAVAEGIVIGNLVRLYRALGGGWDPNAPPPAVPNDETEQVARVGAPDTAG
ncbi:MAG: efflux transporter outer membrane subunit [Thermoanaerobaculales bacterium]